MSRLWDIYTRDRFTRAVAGTEDMGREHQRKYKKYEIWIRFKFYVHVYIECRIINNLRIEVNTQYKTREAVTVTGVGGWCLWSSLSSLSLSLLLHSHLGVSSDRTKWTESLCQFATNQVSHCSREIIKVKLKPENEISLPTFRPCIIHHSEFWDENRIKEKCENFSLVKCSNQRKDIWIESNYQYS